MSGGRDFHPNRIPRDAADDEEYVEPVMGLDGALCPACEEMFIEGEMLFRFSARDPRAYPTDDGRDGRYICHRCMKKPENAPLGGPYRLRKLGRVE